MSYVQWNSSKYHILDNANNRRTKIITGPSGTRWVDVGQDGYPVVTSCGSPVPSGNKYFETLPVGIDRFNDVCHKCGGRVGVPKIDPKIEEARLKQESETRLRKFQERMYESRRQMFEGQKE